jgi:hypothetical protein
LTVLGREKRKAIHGGMIGSVVVYARPKEDKNKNYE